MQQVHFIGIGGIGISALARMMLGQGKKVSGSDLAPSPITRQLERLGIRIFIKHSMFNIKPAVDLVVYTIALDHNNPELAEARRRGIRTLSYPELLGEVAKNKFTIAVAGTHGKTTTAAMLAKIFIDAGRSPTVIVGTILPEYDSNFVAGESEYLIVEACEYRRSFLHLTPRILVITNIDNDHLDYYRDLADIQSAFAELAAKVPKNGRVITEKEYGRVKLPVVLKVPGEHNQRNAQAAIAAAVAVGITEGVARKAISGFRGTWRRFEYKGRTERGAAVYDDYGHHPAEIRATLQAAREVAKGRIFLAFQPHLYSRTKLLFDEFAAGLALADDLVLLPIYPAREPPDPTVSSQLLAQAARGRHCSDFAEARDYLSARAGPEDLILVMGAGDIFHLAELLV